MIDSLDPAVVSLAALVIVVCGLLALWRGRILRAVVCGVLLWLLATHTTALPALAGG